MIELSVSEKKFIINSSYYGTYLLHTISLLTRACCLNKPSKTTMQAQTEEPPFSYNFALDTSLANQRYVPDKEELELLQTFDHYRWWTFDS